MWVSPAVWDVKLWEALTVGEMTEKYFFGSKIESDWQVGSSISYICIEANGVDSQIDA